MLFSLHLQSSIILGFHFEGGSINQTPFLDDNELLLDYLHGRVFLSRTRRLIFATRKFGVLKANLCKRSKALREICQF